MNGGGHYVAKITEMSIENILSSIFLNIRVHNSQLIEPLDWRINKSFTRYNARFFLSWCRVNEWLNLTAFLRRKGPYKPCNQNL